MKMIHYETNAALIDATEKLLRQTLARPGNLLLSGGTSPYAVYNRIAASPTLLHPRRMLFMGDERMVPPDSDKNNWHNLQPMIHALKAENQSFGTDTTLPIEMAAATFAERVAPLATIDLALLGIGTDGHTCGFFTREQARIREALTLFTDRPDGMQGVSVTPTVLHRTERIIILAPGASKTAILSTLQTAPETLPAGVALLDHPNTEIWTDQSV